MLKRLHTTFHTHPVRLSVILAVIATGVGISLISGYMMVQPQTPDVAEAAAIAVAKPVSIKSNNFTTLGGGAWAVSGSTYKLTNPAKPVVDSIGNANYAIANVAVKGDFTESVDFMVTDSSSAWDDASVIFDWTDVNNYYFASFNSSANDTTNGIFRISGGVQTRLAPFSKTFAAGVTRHAIVTRTGKNISVSLDAVIVGTATDPLLPATGFMGVGSRNDTVSFTNFLVTIPADVTAPTVPDGLKSAGTTTTATTISWTASSDSEGVTGYRIYRNDTQIGTTTNALTYASNDLKPGTSYTYTVAAIDAAGNVSAKSAALNVTTPTFVHPGVLLNKTQLDFVKNKLYANGSATGAQPWSAALVQAQTKAKADTGSNSGKLFSSLAWTPHPVKYVLCGAKDGSRPDSGCADEITDAQAAYTHALLWYYTGNAANGEKAIEILNAWGTTLIDHKLDLGTTADGVLQSSWGGELFPRTAEIMRYLYIPAAGKPALNVAKFSNMLRTAYLPHVIDGWYGFGANWITSMASATMDIGVFLDDKAVFDNGVSDWRGAVPAIIYMNGDTNKWPKLAGMPISSPGTMYDKDTMTADKFRSGAWYGATSFVSGLQSETCRDMNHMAMGMGAMINGAETARLQGVDLYGEQKARIVKAMEYNTGLLTAAVINGKNPPAGSVCGKALNVTDGAWRVTWEMGYNAYALRQGVAMPNTASFLTNKVRPSNYRTSMFMDYETLTHYGTP